jgi:hypothetical protein
MKGNGDNTYTPLEEGFGKKGVENNKTPERWNLLM